MSLGREITEADVGKKCWFRSGGEATIVAIHPESGPSEPVVIAFVGPTERSGNGCATRRTVRGRRSSATTLSDVDIVRIEGDLVELGRDITAADSGKYCTLRGGSRAFIAGIVPEFDGQIACVVGTLGGRWVCSWHMSGMRSNTLGKCDVDIVSIDGDA
jgi:hypothetical protein